MQSKLIVKFSGDEADNNRILAYEGTQSLTGASRSLLLVNNYLITGEIRKRSPFSDNVKIYLEPPEKGSFNALITIIIENIDTITWLGPGIFIGVTSNFIADFLKSMFSRSVGKKHESNNDDVQKIEEERPGDVDALVDAIEPSIKQAHSAIARGADSIVIVRGDNNVINLNAETKEYVSTSLMLPEDEFLDVSVGSFNVNTGYGRCFVHSLGKTVPFQIIGRQDPGTAAALSHSLNQYANSLPSDVQIRFRRVVSPDGTTKKFIVLGAEIPEPE